MVDGYVPPRRRLSGLKFHLIWLAAGLVLALVIFKTGSIHDESQGVGLAFQPWALATLLAFSLAYTLLWWRRLDEAAREAHKWAWFWGANVGATGALAVLMLGEKGIAAAEKIGFDNTLGDGMALVLAFEILAYAIGWGVWWLRRR